MDESLIFKIDYLVSLSPPILCTSLQTHSPPDTPWLLVPDAAAVSHCIIPGKWGFVRGTGGRTSGACSDQLVAHLQHFALMCLGSGLCGGHGGSVCSQPSSKLCGAAQMRTMDGTNHGVCCSQPGSMLCLKVCWRGCY